MTKKDEKQEVERVSDAVLTQKDCEQLQADILNERNMAEKTYFRLGELLSVMKEGRTYNHKPVYKNLGYTTFEEFCEKKLGIHSRKGYYLLDVFKETKKGVLSQKQAEDLGWTKASIISSLSRVGVVSKDNVGKWVDTAKESTWDQLRALAKAAKEKAKKNAEPAKAKATKEDDVVDPEDLADQVPEEVFAFRVGLFKAQHENWMLALEKAKKLTGSDKIPHLVDTIATCFLSDAYDSTEQSLSMIAERIEKAFGVTMYLVNDEEEIVYGKENVDALLAANEKG